jgi:OmpA-OmpF porin, OOP family
MRNHFQAMTMKKFYIAAFAILSFCSAQAQFTQDYLKAADNYYRKGDYFSAAQYYEKFLEGKGAKGEQYNPYVIQASSKKSVATSSREQAIYNLAESYRQLNYHVKAEPVYRQIVQSGNTDFPLAQYHYATTLRALGKYDEAEKAFNDFLAGYKSADIYSEAAGREIQNLRFIKQQLDKKDLGLYSLSKAPAELNTTGASYAPFWMDQNTLLFTSTRPEGEVSDKSKAYVNRVYKAAYAGGNLSGIEKTSLPQEMNVHQGVVSAMPDGNTMFLTRWSFENGKKTAQLYKSTKTNGQWSQPGLLSGDMNVAGSNNQQPFVTADGKYLIFSSDRSGGQGGFDLWYAVLDANGNAGTPVNMGSSINTKWDEQAPFHHAASNTLVFSSNGRVGMGGYDFFYSKGSINNWAEPVNFGYPVNSVKDDIYFASRGTARNILEDVFISSDRSAECCLELFFLKKEKPLKQVKGTIVSCDSDRPIQGATVTVLDTVNNKVVFTQTTDASGNYSFALEEFQPLKVTANATGYLENSINVATVISDEQIQLQYPQLCLNTPEVDKPILLENIYFEFNRATLTPESHEMLDKLASMLADNPNVVIEISAHTDSKGSDTYNQKLSDARAQSVVDYLAGKGIDKSRLESKGYGESQPVAPNQNDDGSDNAEGRQKNRRTEFKVIRK